MALRNLVKQELDATIQGGEHSSVRPLSTLGCGSKLTQRVAA